MGMGSSGFALTTVEMRMAKETAAASNYLKFLAKQKEFGRHVRTAIASISRFTQWMLHSACLQTMSTLC
jgi:hypothetical protein